MSWEQLPKEDRLIVISELYTKMREELYKSQERTVTSDRHRQLYEVYLQAARKLSSGIDV